MSSFHGLFVVVVGILESRSMVTLAAVAGVIVWAVMWRALAAVLPLALMVEVTTGTTVLSVATS